MSVRIGGLQRFSLIDYPGRICATIFTQGCNFRCPYCHNPELVDPARYGPAIPEEQILSFLEKRRGKVEAVTLTGGEPTIQEGLDRFLKTVKAMGFLVKVDTNGYEPDVVETLIRGRLVDYLAMDIKGPLQKYGQIVSVRVDTSRIRKSIDLITTSGVEHEFRTTVVRSQIDIQDLRCVAQMIDKSSLYVLQPFVRSKTLEDSFLSESSYTPLEFSNFRKELETETRSVLIR